MDSSVSEWTPVVRQQPNSQGKNDFVNRYMSIIYTLLHDALVFTLLREFLQLNPDTRERDWYLFEHHKILRIYGDELEPYLLPTYFYS